MKATRLIAILSRIVDKQGDDVVVWMPGMATGDAHYELAEVRQVDMLQGTSVHLVPSNTEALDYWDGFKQHTLQGTAL